MRYSRIGLAIRPRIAEGRARAGCGNTFGPRRRLYFNRVPSMRSKKNRVGSVHTLSQVLLRKLSSCAMRRSGSKNDSRVLRQKARADEMPVALTDDEPRRLAFPTRRNCAVTPQVPQAGP